MYIQAVKSAGSFPVFKSLFDEDLDELREAGIDLEILPVILDKVRYEVYEKK